MVLLIAKVASDFESNRREALAKRTEITIETESLVVLCGRRSSALTWCPQCDAECETIPIEGLGVVSNLAPTEVESWLESELIHRLQAPDGALLICLNSLLKRVRKTTTA